MKKLGLFLFLIASVSILSISSCKKEDDDADKYVGSWVNITDATDIIIITKVNANTLMANGIIQLSVSGSSFTGSQIDDTSGEVSTVTGVLNGNMISVNIITKDAQGNIVDTDSQQYIKS
jgi:hypothetical protein